MDSVKTEAEKPSVTLPAQKKPKFDQLRADHEMFLKAFEKPTQIYRFLRTRNAVQPVYLHRTLSYMKHLRTPRRQHRMDFKVDNMLEVVEKRETEVENNSKLEEGGYLNLTFSSFFFGSGPANGNFTGSKKKSMLEQDLVNAEVYLVKISNKRKKDSDAHIDQTLLGKVAIPFNPNSQLLPASSSGILSVPNSNFKGAKGFSKTFILTIQIAVPYKVPTKGTKRSKNDNSSDSNDIANGNEKPYKENSEPPAKRVRNSSIDEPAEEGNNSKKSADFEIENMLYTAELIMFDNKRNCLLTDGDYELALQEKYKRPGRKRGLLSNKSSWENIFKGNMGPFEVFAYGPTIKFKLSWSSDPAIPLTRRPTTLPLRPTHTNQSTDNNNTTESNRQPAEDAGNPKEGKKRQVIYYQFIYNSHTRQQTEARDDFFCPWCSINCNELYSLLKHLKLCHGRFKFTYAPHNKGACIDVCVNEHYDGSYAGKPEEINDMMGYAFSREGPLKRVSQTQVLLWRPSQRRTSLSEFLETDDMEYETNRPYYNGHKRIYFHSATTLPGFAGEDKDMSDSEEEENPEWMRMRTLQMIDEFTDVNEGEKELMKLWNIHLMTNSFQSDSQVFNACCCFVENNAQEIVKKNLKRNLILHLVNLNDFDLINGGQIQHIITKFHERIFQLSQPTTSE
ncbi:polycomb protein SUZ12-like [Actinia tenebrosa]|uniref:Polycomb protein SUZ12-like n=1 Tax=Actinia tenebrosa TaxID=6105 RepID=A0A6P8J1D4_ACTTE|nr:polycomb protein SUZ12-like [Actinia tenebrosa]